MVTLQMDDIVTDIDNEIPDEYKNVVILNDS